MRRDAVLGSATLLAAAAGGWAWTGATGGGLPEVLFRTVLLAALAVGLHLGVAAHRQARAERARAAEIARLRPREVALAAVREERRRLTDDILATLREALKRILLDAQDVPASAQDVPLRVRRIHEVTQEATSDLRRSLGLLRSADPGAAPAGPSVPAVRTVPRADVALGTAMALLAAVESVAYPLTEGTAWSAGSTAVTVLAAATVAGRRAALGAALVGCASLVLLGSLTGAPVLEGFWMLGTVCVLLWTVAADHGPDLRLLAQAVLLWAAVLVTRWVDSPDNLGITAVVTTAAVAGGALVRLGRFRADTARRRGSVRADELEVASRTAVAAERGAFARELHDVVSHAVGVIAVQAGAAQVSWPADPAGARRALTVIGSTAGATLAELDRLRPGVRRPRTLDELHALIGRIRATGTPVELRVHGTPPASALHTVHRVVQECLTNAVRHAPGASACVTVRAEGGRTAVVVTDDGPAADPGDVRGYGLVGLAERVALAGGSLRTGPGPDGRGFVVEAVLPVRSEAALR